MKKILSYFFQGLIYIAPLGITIYVIYFLFTVIDGFIRGQIDKILDVNIPGLGIVVLFVIITLLGLIGQTIIARPFKRLIQRLIDRAPLIKVIYSSIRDLLSAFVGKEKKFDQPVLVIVNTISNLEKMGFMTQEDLSDLDIKEKVAVYFPHSYNFSGELFIVPRELVRPVDIPSAEAMKFIVSGGVAKN
ncbi:MAG: hypothetical protein AMS27_02850 [Bacteroides sp. SM23_62_1]|nr:MAG: hypothetical protein AMS27_02850 [Bacteroides sp. SM23_62_1]